MYHSNQASDLLPSYTTITASHLIPLRWSRGRRRANRRRAGQKVDEPSENRPHDRHPRESDRRERDRRQLTRADDLRDLRKLLVGDAGVLPQVRNLFARLLEGALLLECKLDHVCLVSDPLEREYLTLVDEEERGIALDPESHRKQLLRRPVDLGNGDALGPQLRGDVLVALFEGLAVAAPRRVELDQQRARFHRVVEVCEC
mmetsp:Transcript_6926/g.16957  ORF Transcript_6926/g.16957 Transcript_6926/m.16957 type:complete len:202 (-) Transcript_6926:198-803(-)